MKNVWVDWKSIYLGTKAMTAGHGMVNYSLELGRWGWWFHCWTPSWHKGRGCYISIGLGFIRFLRGY